jgi:predicted nucleotidyltransferase
MISIEDRHLKILQNIFSSYPYEFYLFGSRLKGTAKKFSDLDLFYKDPIPDRILLALEEDLEDSDLPYKVDIVDYRACNPEFQKILQESFTPLSTLLSHKVSS